ncbi:TRAP transporter substrate-binding protein [Desulfovermiculus halophilus]|uniref:TRAP transporter substrate-binding protein n=1 Tax=Desulfovermiculus halophilus TaxID=339722 RepID=UPI000A056103|nr:TRAP transporter substrate-binding protein [Desulfovermiculus halophilus]
MNIRAAFCALCMLLTAASAAIAGPQSLDRWKPDFDPSGAEYTCIISNVSHPVIKGGYAGYALRDAMWEATQGKIYIDYKPFSMLGGEVEVLNMLKMGAIQGMGVSSVAATNLGPRFGLVNLPFLINSYAKLDRFVDSGKLFEHFLRSMLHQGIVGLDITTYGTYGWATTEPVTDLDQARRVKFRIAEAAVNQLLYRKWDLSTVVMPWPDVHVALKQNVITGLDHSPIVCNITKKFEVAQHFTRINYAQGLYIWIFNQSWLQSLPPELRETFERVVHEVYAEIRGQGQAQEEEQIALAQEAGVKFHQLPEQDMAWLQQKGHAVHEQYAQRINALYPSDPYRPDDYLGEVQEYMGYEPVVGE